MWPLLSPKPFSDYTAESYLAYVRTLYIAPPAKKVSAEYSASLNKKGNLTLRITRTPKFVTAAEVSKIAADVGKSLQETWLLIRKRKIEIRRG